MNNKKHNSKYILTDEGTGFPFFILIHCHLFLHLPARSTFQYFHQLQSKDNSNMCKQRLTCWVQWVTNPERQSFTYIVHIFLQGRKVWLQGERGREGCSALDTSFLMRSHFHDKIICKSCESRNLVFVSYVIYSTSAIISIQIKCCGSKTALWWGTLII